MTEELSELIALKYRFGEEMLSKRLRQQVKISTSPFGEGYGRFHWENLRFIPQLLKTILKGLGVLERGHQNCLDFKIKEVVTRFHELPDPFDGYRILHLSDLHLDGMLDKGHALGKIVRNLKYDLCVMTGDFRFDKLHGYDDTLTLMARLLKDLNCQDGCFGVLGNHDFIEKVPGFEKLGLKILLNESVDISRGAETIHLAGIDDPHFYGTYDIEKACKDIPSTDFNILLVHSPEVVEEAAAAKINLYLCGHTHGGQICLPGGIPILTNSFGHREFSHGGWKYAGMQGYTSSGTGSSGYPVRYHCPPEITIHRLLKNP